MQYDFDAITRSIELKKLESRSNLLMKRWCEFLPIENPALIEKVTLGEHETPLLKSEKLGSELGLRNLYIKNDTYFPTASLKDRSMPLIVLKALEFGYDTVAIVSSGNAAASLAAYAAKAGLRAVTFVSGNPPIEQLAKIKAYGPTIVWIKGPYDVVENLFTKAREKFGWFDCDGLVNPFRLEGKKIYAHEITLQLGWKVPDVFMMVVGFGNGIVAAWKGFKELYEMGIVKSLPRMIAVQPENCAPIAKAFAGGKEEVEPVKCGETVAQNIALGNPSIGGKRTLKAVRESNGLVLTVSDKEIIDAARELAQKEGLFVEPAGVLGVAALKQLVKDGKVEKDETIVPVITGHGMNNSRFAVANYRIPEAIEPSLEEVEKAVTRNR